MMHLIKICDQLKRNTKAASIVGTADRVWKMATKSIYCFRHMRIGIFHKNKCGKAKGIYKVRCQAKGVINLNEHDLYCHPDL